MKFITKRGAPAGAMLVALLLTGGAASTEGDGHAHGAHGAEGGEESRLEQGAGLIGARDLFLDNCASCHGPRGHGTDAAQNDFAAPDALVRLTPEAIAEALEGEPHRALAGGLSDDAQQALIGYLRSYLMLPAPAADTVAGRAIYARDCSVCHGDRGNAASWAKNSLKPAPADFTAHGLDQLSREEMIEAVTFGKENSAMMGFATQLDREEIAATVDYIREAFMPETGPADHAGTGHDHEADEHEADEHGADEHEHASAEGTASYPGGLTGDHVWGEAFYRANCAECHGEKGDGEGPRAYFMVVKPENFLSREARAELDREHLFEEIGEGVTGTVMPAWDKVLTSQQIANVAEYVYRAFLRPDEFGDAAAGPEWQPADADPGAKKN